MEIIDPAKIAAKYLEESRSSVEQLGAVPRVIGFIASEDKPSLAYANTTRRVFTEAGFEYELRPIARLALESAIHEANEDTSVHGIFIYFPVFHGQEDNYLRNIVDY
ncbi:MAG: methylenetetrahydrofolate dehydrogenase (NAD+), partial [Candidatus Azotimanducaceae bacterium]